MIDRLAFIVGAIALCISYVDAQFLYSGNADQAAEFAAFNRGDNALDVGIDSARLHDDTGARLLLRRSH